MAVLRDAVLTQPWVRLMMRLRDGAERAEEARAAGCSGGEGSPSEGAGTTASAQEGSRGPEEGEDRAEAQSMEEEEVAVGGGPQNLYRHSNMRAYRQSPHRSPG